MLRKTGFFIDMKLSSVVTALTLLLCVKTCPTRISVDHNSSSSSNSIASNNNNNNNLAKQIDDFVQHVFDCHRSPALTLAVVKDGQVVLAKGYGFTTSAKTTQTTSKTRFAIGSLTKAFTSILVAKAIQSNGNITMDTSISEYIQNFRLSDDYRSRHVTMRDLLAHRTGLVGSELPEIFGIDPDTSRKAFTRKLQYMSSPYSFRDKFIYNNYMYVLAGDILEQLSGGAKWEDLVNGSIFTPLGMSDSGFVDRLQDFEREFAMPCEFLNGTLVDLLPAVLHIVHVFGPAGSIYSTADDMAKWMNFLLSKKDDTTWNATDLDPSLLDMIFEPSMTLSPGLRRGFSRPLHPASSASQNYGMGWWSGLYRDFNRIMHSGGIATQSSRLILFPDMNAGLFAAVNGPFGGKRDLLRGIIYRVSDLLLGLPTWFNTPEACQKPYPWSIHKTNDNTQNKTEENATEKEHVSESAPLFNDTTCPSLLNMSAYVGTYSNKVIGDAIVTHNTSIPCRLIFTYGRIGLFHLSPKSKEHFSVVIMGPASFLNAYSLIKGVDFRFHDVVASRVLSLSIGMEGLADIFYKNVEETSEDHGGQNNASSTTS